ncbi:MAG: hypothetical protein J6D54_06600 [Olsenella sp.]|nr:hypothetical protein [Olsenella sp.]
MKITSFNPLIVTKDATPVIELFEALGFERRHTLEAEASGGIDTTNFRMKNEDGFYVDISQVEVVPQDMTIIRMNVPDFDEAYDFLISKGFTHRSGRVVETETNKSAMLTSPSGFAFDLCQHIRK